MRGLPDGFVSVSELANGAVLLLHRDGSRVVASLDSAGRLWIDRRAPGEPTRRRVHDPAAHATSNPRAGNGPTGDVVAPTGGILRSVDVAVGDRVAAGTVLATLEAMKMQIEIRASTEGTVASIEASVGSRVERGAIVVRVA